MRQKHFMITAGTTSAPLMLESAPRNDLEAAQRAVMQAQYSQTPQLAIAPGPSEFKDFSTTNYNNQSRGNVGSRQLALPGTNANN
jgi:hypothetical protein